LSALAMLGKYYSGVFLLGIFLSTLVNQKGRAWLLTARPWLSLLVFALALLPHLEWLRSHDFVTLHYVGEQGGTGGTDWRLLFKFTLAPIAYWLLPWLLVTLIWRASGTSVWGTLQSWPQRMWQSWRPHGWGDTLFWFALLPWAITLAFGMSGFVELSLPWAIPIGYGFSLLWLRNLSQQPIDTQLLTKRLIKCLWVWWVIVLLISPWYAWQQAKNGTDNHYLPRREAAAALLQQWQTRNPNVPLAWVGGQWAESALLAFYGDNRLRVVPEVPDQFPATVHPLSQWEKRGGLLVCPMGPVSAPNGSNCPERMKAWLASHQQKSEPIDITVRSEGLRFPLDKPFRYIAFEYLPHARKASD
jgi:hypothetical protein